MTPFISATWTLIAGAMVLFLPGLAWLALFWDPDQDTFERLAEVLGLSISMTAVLALFAYLLNWQLTSTFIIAFYVLLAFPALWGLRRWWFERTWGLSYADQPGEETVDLEDRLDQDEQFPEKR